MALLSSPLPKGPHYGILAEFGNPADLYHACERVRDAGFTRWDAHTPFPVHGLDRAMGLRDTSLHTAGFIYAIAGTSIALGFISWVFTTDWPLNIGGKPHFALPAWIPIIFELTVLMSAVGMVLTFCYLCQMAPFVKKHHFHLRATDDTFVMVIECSPKTNEGEVQAFLQSAGAREINIQHAETGWWLGTYDKEQKLFASKGEITA